MHGFSAGLTAEAGNMKLAPADAFLAELESIRVGGRAKRWRPEDVTRVAQEIRSSRVLNPAERKALLATAIEVHDGLKLTSPEVEALRLAA